MAQTIRHLDRKLWKEYKEICKEKNIKIKIDFQQKVLNYMKENMLENITKNIIFNDLTYIKLCSLPNDVWLKIKNFSKIQNCSIGYILNMVLNDFIGKYKNRIANRQPVDDLFINTKFKYEIVSSLVITEKEKKDEERLLNIKGLNTDIINDFLITCALTEQNPGEYLTNTAAMYISNNKFILSSKFGEAQANDILKRALVFRLKYSNRPTKL